MKSTAAERVAVATIRPRRSSRAKAAFNRSWVPTSCFKPSMSCLGPSSIPGQVRYQFDGLVLLGGHRETRRAAVGPCPEAFADAVPRPHQCALVDEVVGHRGHRLRLAAGQIELLDALGRFPVAVGGHGLGVEVLVAV